RTPLRRPRFPYTTLFRSGFFLDAGSGTIVIGGHDLGRSREFRNIQQGSTVSLVVDELTSTDPWVVRGIEIRGTAEALTDHEPPRSEEHTSELQSRENLVC